MIIASWNVRGLNDPLKAKEVRRFLGTHCVDFVGLLETKVKAHNTTKVQKRFGPNWTWVDNNGYFDKGRIWIGWCSDLVDFRAMEIHEQYIHGILTSVDRKHAIMVTVVYGLNTIGERKELWRKLGRLGVQDWPWLLTGDFNSILLLEDRRNGAEVTLHELVDFRAFIDDMGLAEIPSVGSYFSWSGKGDGEIRVQSRIDRGLGNEHWMHQYDYLKVQYLTPGISDHSPLIYKFEEPKRNAKPFRFFNIVAEHPDFLQKVRQAWHQEVKGTAMYQVWQKLKFVKKEVKELHKNSFSEAHTHLEEARKELLAVQELMVENGADELLQRQEKQCIKTLKHWYKVEESILKQKSRVDWLQLGDQNTRFFFSAMKQRHARNTMVTMMNEAGDFLTEPDQIQHEVLSFYKNLLGSKTQGLQEINQSYIRQGPLLSSVSQQGLVKPVTPADIDAALKSIDDSKAPGVDGFNSFFFKKTWEVVKPLIYDAVQEFFNKGTLLKQWNCTSITLVPKVAHPSLVKEYRPIACCSVGL